MLLEELSFWLVLVLRGSYLVVCLVEKLYIVYILSSLGFRVVVDRIGMLCIVCPPGW